MNSRNTLISSVLAWAALANAAPGQTFSPVFSFPPGGGALPNGKLLNRGIALYGTTYNGGAANAGTIFKLVPSAGGVTNESVLYTFTDGPDGGRPTAGLIADSSGALYGTASTGGTGSGVVFQLSPPVPGGSDWAYHVIYTFGAVPNDGASPNCDLAFDSSGFNLYGTTVLGGASGKGTVFQLIPTTTGTWTENILYSFNGISGARPYSNIVISPTGDLFGTTSSGGVYGFGTVFELIPPTISPNPYIHLILHEFSGKPDGKYPLAGVLVSQTGLVFGTTYGGGTGSAGTVYMLTPPTSGIVYTETVIHSFGGVDGDANPSDVLALDRLGNFYGTTGGAAFGKQGNVFKMTPPAAAGGPYGYVSLYSFSGGVDGQAPLASLINTGSDTFYGTTFYGGQFGDGTVFQLK